MDGNKANIAVSKHQISKKAPPVTHEMNAVGAKKAKRKSNMKTEVQMVQTNNRSNNIMQDWLAMQENEEEKEEHKQVLKPYNAGLKANNSRSRILQTGASRSRHSTLLNNSNLNTE